MYKFFLLYTAIFVNLAGAAYAGAEKQNKSVKKFMAPFIFNEPRWQVVLNSYFVTFNDYDNLKRNGRGIGFDGMFRLTRAISLALESAYYFLRKVHSPPEKYIETENTQIIKLKGLFRYDLDVLELHPYIAVGGSIYFFVKGNLGKFDIIHWGPEIEGGLDFLLIQKLLLGIEMSYGWLLKYSPPPGNDYPTFIQLSIKAGSMF